MSLPKLLLLAPLLLIGAARSQIIPTVADLYGSPSSLLVLTSATNPVLAAGSTYYLTLEPTFEMTANNTKDATYYWYQGTTNTTGRRGGLNYFVSRDGWVDLRDQITTEMPAFSVSGAGGETAYTTMGTSFSAGGVRWMYGWDQDGSTFDAGTDFMGYRYFVAFTPTTTISLSEIKIALAFSESESKADNLTIGLYSDSSGWPSFTSEGRIESFTVTGGVTGSAVPEPSAYAALSGVFALLFAAHRKVRRGA